MTSFIQISHKKNAANTSNLSCPISKITVLSVLRGLHFLSQTKQFPFYDLLSFLQSVACQTRSLVIGRNVHCIKVAFL